MRKSPRSFTSAFTLIELLTVIAIIGVLAAIIIPTVGAVREKAQRAVDGNNLREIIKAAQIYAGDNNDRLPDPRAVPAATMTANPQSHLWPGIIARNNILTDATFYFSKSDPFFNGVYPISIISTTDTTKRTLDNTFRTASALAWEFASGIKMSDGAAMPVAWTRGLQTNGSWSLTSGTYKDVGGYIGFLGGNVAFYSNAGTGTSGIFTSNFSARKTTNIQQAIPTAGFIWGTPPTGPGAGTILGRAAGTPAARGP